MSIAKVCALCQSTCVLSLLTISTVLAAHMYDYQYSYYQQPSADFLDLHKFDMVLQKSCSHENEENPWQFSNSKWVLSQVEEEKQIAPDKHNCLNNYLKKQSRQSLHFVSLSVILGPKPPYITYFKGQHKSKKVEWCKLSFLNLARWSHTGSSGIYIRQTAHSITWDRLLWDSSHHLPRNHQKEASVSNYSLILDSYGKGRPLNTQETWTGQNAQGDIEIT